MIMKIIEMSLIIAYIVINLFTAKKMNAESMRDEFIEGQCTVGMIFTNIFYAPAWILKGLRFVVLATIS